ncbi:ferredoxin [Streptomyces litchfieldiae]|uniref:Ferredoxin n=1 Tax=Streptomyces litchfieldiae TaxID=3075543 RepID=A0ABU2MPB2_9ACTN|nr:ferredoxin [Streptomyces sp. DSM 44938]MDT0343451.1 ferredoxin [Streptomyces sp. DSM 44938]
MDETTGPRWRVTVNAERCSGTGMCAHAAPDTFDLVDHVSRPLRTVIAPDEQVLDASENCPLEAITITEEGTGRLLGPLP